MYGRKGEWLWTRKEKVDGVEPKNVCWKEERSQRSMYLQYREIDMFW